MGLRERKQWKNRENYIMKNYIICNLPNILYVIKADKISKIYSMRGDVRNTYSSFIIQSES